jgi:two-component system, sensor histidine kinase and response regulator
MLLETECNPSLRILLAEDQPINQKIVLLMLQRLGYQADVADNGLEALEALQCQLYDVVLLDVQMPEMDGLEVARWVCQQRQPNQRPYLIAITAHTVQGDRERCLSAGMDRYLSKPLRLQVLAQELSQCKPLPPSATPLGTVPQEVSAPHAFGSGVQQAKPDAIDLAVLTAFRQEMGDIGDAVITELITCYLEEAPQLLQTLRTAVSQQDAKTVQCVAHGLKACSASLGAIPFSQRCGELEAMALSAPIEQITAMMARLESEYTSVKAALNHALKPL